MALLTLITHAHTQIDPATDATAWRLSVTGQSQAVALARQPFWGDVSRILVSSEPKTRLTVGPLLARRNLPLSADRRFDEVLRPGWTEAYAARVRRCFADPARPAGEWEPAADALQRFLGGVYDRIDPVADEQVALVSHGLVLSLFRAHVLGLPRASFDAWQELGFAAVARVDLRQLALLQDFKPVAPSPSRR